MITKINKIKNLGLVFASYTGNASLPLFKKFNLIYGWNGSGKTTLSRLFDVIGGDSVADLEYEIEDGAGNKYSHGEVFPKKIRVFNQDYIQNNVKMLESRASTISVLLGEENKDLIEKIEEDKKLLDGNPTDPTNRGKIVLRSEHKKNRRRKSDERDERFTEIARTIGAAIGGNALRDYRKPQAEKEFSSITIKADLSDDDLSKFSLSAKQESLPSISLLALKPVNLENGSKVEVSVFLETIRKEAELLLAKTVESEIVKRLTENRDISEWVEQGIHLQEIHKSTVCEYCLQKIPSSRVKELARHFNEADGELKADIDVLVEKLKKVYATVQSVQANHKALLYKDLQDSHGSTGADFEIAKQLFLSNITELAEELKSKKSKTTEELALKTKTSIDDFLVQIKKLNEIIVIHNKKTSDFDGMKKEAVQKLKVHYLSTIFDEVKKYSEAIMKHDEEIKSLDSEISEIQERIVQNMAKISSKHKACEAINKKLTTFLGHQELTFIPHIEIKSDENGKEKEVVSGYDIMRGENPAIYLSEGEKTAIAFVYFVVHLSDQEFDVDDGIIVVDDPISSLDSNSQYQAFSFLKNAVKDGSQVFIFTHSFDFLKLLINWRRGLRDGTTNYYMIKNNFPSNTRCAYIDKMDKELAEYESEYHYLFKLLKELKIEQDDSIAKAYPIPNIARKVWDTFLMFSVPNGKSSYNKMEELKKDGHDEQKLDAIYKFTNDHSHITGSGFDPVLVPETKKVVNELFEMMSTISPSHFEIIDKATN